MFLYHKHSTQLLLTINNNNDDNDSAPASFDQKFAVVQAKLGDSSELECETTGDGPLSVDWYIATDMIQPNNTTNSSQQLAKHSDSFDIHEDQKALNGNSETLFALTSRLRFRSVNSSDAKLYRCIASNEFGSAERQVKLVVLSAPQAPLGLRVRDVWSRSALVAWAAPPTNARVNNFTVQYWRHSFVAAASLSSAQHLATPSSVVDTLQRSPILLTHDLVSSHAQTNQQQLQRHRREELTVDGLQTSALITGLQPAVSYELSVVARNSVGQSEPSLLANFTTTEEEPSAPPTDVQIEAKGGSALRVAWKAPPLETWNGQLIGYYVGYRPRNPNNQNHLNGLPAQIQQQQQQHQATSLIVGQSSASNVFSFKTALVSDQLSSVNDINELFITNLRHNEDYEVTVRAFNKAGSGPECHALYARTSSPRLPPAPVVQLEKINAQSASFRWSAMAPRLPASHSVNSVQAQSVTAFARLDIARFVVAYRALGDFNWLEVSVSRSSPLTGESAASGVSPSPLSDYPANLSPLAVYDSQLSLLSQADPSLLLQAQLPPLHTASHTLNNLEPNTVYRAYVSSVNDFGIGDPSNIITFKTEPLVSSSMVSGSTGTHLSSSAATLSSFFGFNNQIINGQGLSHYSNPTIAAIISTLILLLIALVAFICVTQAKRMRSSYSSSSPASSWTQATGDTMQSELQFSATGSRKQHAGPPTLLTRQAYAAQFSTGRQGHKQHPSRRLLNTTDALSSQQLDAQQQHTHATKTLMHNMRREPLLPVGVANTLGRPPPPPSAMLTSKPHLSSHYQQPVDVKVPAATLQFGTNRRAHLGTSGVSSTTTTRQQQQQQQHRAIQQAVASATLNRNINNRQLPPLPANSNFNHHSGDINTGGDQIQPPPVPILPPPQCQENEESADQQTWAVGSRRHRSSRNISSSQQHQQQQQQHLQTGARNCYYYSNGNNPTNSQQQTCDNQQQVNTNGSQTPLIYGIIE